MITINGPLELIVACNNLKTSVEIPQKLPMEIAFVIQNNHDDEWLPENITEYFAKYFKYLSEITNDKFFIKIVLNSTNGDSMGNQLRGFIKQLKNINILNKVYSMSFDSHDITKRHCSCYFSSETLRELPCLYDIEFKDAWCGSYDSDYAMAIIFVNNLNDFCKKNTNIQSIRLTECREYLKRCIETENWQEAYLDLQNTLKENQATLDKLANCIDTINDLQKAINEYNSRLLETTKIIKIVYDNDKKHFEEISAQIEKTKQIFKEYSEILIRKNNCYVYFYLAQYQLQCEGNYDYKQFFEYLDKITFPLDSDPQKDKHADLYYKGKASQATMCLAKAQYAQIKGIDAVKYAKDPTKDDNDNYTFPYEIETERMRLALKYALEAKQESANLAECTLQEYIFGKFISSDVNDFADINSKDKNAFDVIWQLVEAFKKHVENKPENNILIFSSRQLTPAVNIPKDSDLEESNARKRPRSSSASPTL